MEKDRIVNSEQCMGAWKWYIVGEAGSTPLQWGPNEIEMCCWLEFCAKINALQSIVCRFCFNSKEFRMKMPVFDAIGQHSFTICLFYYYYSLFLSIISESLLLFSLFLLLVLILLLLLLLFVNCDFFIGSNQPNNIWLHCKTLYFIRCTMLASLCRGCCLPIIYAGWLCMSVCLHSSGHFHHHIMLLFCCIFFISSNEQRRVERWKSS